MRNVLGRCQTVSRVVRRCQEGIRWYQECARSDGVRELSNGDRNILGGVKKLSDGVRKVYYGIRKMSDGVRIVSDGFKTYSHIARKVLGGVRKVSSLCCYK